MIDAQYISIEGSLAFVEAAGDGPVVLCIHTAGQSGVQWSRTLRELSALGYRVVVPDLPGHGRSEPAVGGPIRDLGDYADWCIELIERLALERPYVLGCSIGGKIALDIAIKRSSDLAGVIAMAAEGYGEGAAAAAAITGLERGMEDAASPSRSDRTYYGTLAACGSAVPAERAEFIATMHRREDPIITSWDLIGWFSHDIREVVSTITCPTYLVVGDGDFWLDVDRVRWTGEQIEGARTLVLPGIGHYPMEEIPDFPVRAREWMESLAAGPSDDRSTGDTARASGRESRSTGRA